MTTLAYQQRSGGNAAEEYHNYLSASLGGPLPGEVQSLFPGSSSYRAQPRGNASFTLPPPGFLHTSELSLGCKLGWSNNKRSVFPHSFEPEPASSLEYHNATTASDAMSEHATATNLVDWMLGDASMSSCSDVHSFKQQLAERIECDASINVAKAGITMGAHPSQAEQRLAAEQCRRLGAMDMGSGSWERFKQTMQSIERGAAAGGGGALAGSDPRHELLSMLAQPVGLDRLVRADPAAKRFVPWEEARAPSAAPRGAPAARRAAQDAPWTELATRADALRRSQRSLQAACDGLRAELDAPAGRVPGAAAPQPPPSPPRQSESAAAAAAAAATARRPQRPAAVPLLSSSVSTEHLDRARSAPMYEVTVRGPLSTDYSYKALRA